MQQQQQPRHQRAQKQLEEFLRSYRWPGVSIAYSIDGGRIQTLVAGVRKNPESVPLSASDRFALGSNSKGFTAVLIAHMIEQSEGRIRWNSSILDVARAAGFEKDNPGMKIHPDFASVTLEMVLTHTGGFPGESHSRLSKTKPKDRYELVTQLLQDGPVVPESTTYPGRQYDYSDYGYTVLATLAERLSVPRLSWRELVTQTIFKPLKMKNCGFFAPGPRSLESLPPQEPWGHKPVKGAPMPEALTPYSLTLGDYESTLIEPAAGIFCSAEDWARFAQFQMSGLDETPPAPILVQPASFQKLFTKHRVEYYTYGAFMGKSTFFYHYGANGGFTSIVMGSRPPSKPGEKAYDEAQHRISIVAAANYGGDGGAFGSLYNLCTQIRKTLLGLPSKAR